jgi:putative ABC transport system permease protein
VPILEGRTFAAGDQASSHIIINHALAARLWPGASAVGRRFRTDAGDTNGWKLVVGVVGDMDIRISSDRPLRYQVYAPWPPAAPAGVGVAGQRSYVPHMLLVRADDPDGVPRLVQDIVRSLDPQQPVERIVAADDTVRTVFAREFFVQRILLAFAAFGLVLAATGIFGVLSHAVRSRARELAIRVAVGASPTHIRYALMARTVPFGALGVTAGAGGGVALGRVLGTLLHGVSPVDPVTLLLASLVLVTTGVGAAWLPIRQALRADPAAILRHER